MSRESPGFSRGECQIGIGKTAEDALIDAWKRGVYKDDHYGDYDPPNSLMRPMRDYDAEINEPEVE